MSVVVSVVHCFVHVAQDYMSCVRLAATRCITCWNWAKVKLMLKNGLTIYTRSLKQRWSLFNKLLISLIHMILGLNVIVHICLFAFNQDNEGW